MPTHNTEQFKIKVAEKRSRDKVKNKKTPIGSLVRYKKDKGRVITTKKRTTAVMVERNLGGGNYKEFEIIVPGRLRVVRDKFNDRKSPTNFHKKKRMRVRDQTHKPYKVDYIEGITVPQANWKSDNWWDCGRWDYKIRL